MNDLLTIIKKAALDAVKASRPMEMLFATVTQEEDIPHNIPLLIQIEQKKPLTRSFFVENSLLDGLKKGDRLVILQMQGGQRYYILEVIKED